MRRLRRHALYAVPLLVLAILAAVMGYGLLQPEEPLPSALLDRPAPETDLPPLTTRPGDGEPQGLSNADLTGEVTLVNFWASWCGPCRVEHPVLGELAREHGVTVHGINYRDNAQEAGQWLANLGDIYTRIGVDADGRNAIEWGVAGVPETYIVDAQGVVRYKHTGPITREDAAETILPVIEELRP